MEILKMAVEHYGPENQIRMMFEEMAELQKELCKHLRGEDRRKQIVEEIADVSIMLRQMIIIFDIEDEVSYQEMFKLGRLAQRMEGE